MNLKKGSLESLVLFLLSPFLSFPFLLIQILGKNKFALRLLFVLFGLIGFAYIPSVTNDKAKYYLRYDLYKDFDFSQFAEYLVYIKRPDFIFESLIFVTSKTMLHLDYLFLVLTWFSVFAVFWVIVKITNYYSLNRNQFIIVVLLNLFVFSLPGLFSGVRFTFGVSLFFISLYYLLYQRKPLWGCILLFLSIQTHFSILYFVPSIVWLYFYRNNGNKLKYMFYVSLLFLFIPPSLTSSLLGSINISESYSSKADLYLNQEDHISQNFNNNSNSLIIYFLRTSWIFLVYLYLIVRDKAINSSGYLITTTSLLYIFLFFINLTYSIPTIYSRYLLIVKILALILIIMDTIASKKNRFLYLFLIFYFISFFTDIYILRFNLKESIFNIENLSIITIFQNHISTDEFLN